MARLNGSKTYVCALLIGLVAALRYAGVIGAEASDFLLLILGGGTAAALRHGVNTSRHARDS